MKKILNEGNQIHNLTVSVRNFVISFNYGFAKARYFYYGSGSTTAKSYGFFVSGSATPNI
jgi:hypothetical protein